MKILRPVIGVACILVGFAGLLLPVVPGFLLIFVGLEFVGLGFLVPNFFRKMYTTVKEHVVVKKDDKKLGS